MISPFMALSCIQPILNQRVGMILSHKKKAVGLTKWKVPILISYAYWDKKTAAALKEWEGHYRLYLDSGAYTAHKQGKEIDFEEYCAFVKSPPVEIERYFMLDKIGDPTQTKKNLDKMISRGLKPIPVFTRGEDAKEIDNFYNVSDLVAVGGVAGTKDAKPYVKWFEQNVRKGRPVHWLGFAQRDFVMHFKPTSFDSTVWVSGCKFGFIQFFHDHSWRLVKREDILAGRYRKQIADLGFDYDELLTEENWRRVARESYTGKITVVSWLKWAKRLEELGNSKALCAAVADLDLPNLKAGKRVFDSLKENVV